ncbi:MAG: hypothetical protein HQL07_01355 [Nitrospirae bacterium]|nr:hypothetical protein [Magnetococcales bacterium]
MHTMVELRRLLAPTAVEFGRVIGLADKVVTVATSKGSCEYPFDGYLRIGDVVTIHGGRASKRRVSDTSAVYYV